MSRLHAVSRGLLVAMLFAAGGCSKLEEKFGNPPGESLPEAPFSIDCRLSDAFVAGDRVPVGDDPAWVRVQINPKGEFYKIVDQGGRLPDYEKIYYETEEYRKREPAKSDDPIFQIGSGIPFITGYNFAGTQSFRSADYPRGGLILEEATDIWFRDGAGGSKGAAIPFMRLDVKERELSIRYEWRKAIPEYAEYQMHRASGPASFDFKCARSSKDTVIEVNGFDQ